MTPVTSGPGARCRLEHKLVYAPRCSLEVGGIPVFLMKAGEWGGFMTGPLSHGFVNGSAGASPTDTWQI